MSYEKNVTAVERAVEAFNDPENRERYFDLYASDVALHGFPPDLPSGVSGVKKFFTGFWSAFPDAELIGEDIIGEEDRLAIRYTIRATHRGEFAGIPPTGKRVTVSGQTILRFANGKCIERWNVIDMLGLLQQLGKMAA